MSIFEKLRETIALTLKVSKDRITETTSNENLAAWDSLGQVNLMMALEQTFDIVLDVEDFQKLTSVSAIMEYLKDQGIK